MIILPYLPPSRTYCAGEHSGYIYIWSREGAGRSHLLHAACAELSQRGDAVGYVPLDKRTWFVPEVLEGMEQLALVCIDNIECVAGDEPWEMAIFNLYNRILGIRQNPAADHRRSAAAAAESWPAGSGLTAGLGADL